MISSHRSPVSLFAAKHDTTKEKDGQKVLGSSNEGLLTKLQTYSGSIGMRSSNITSIVKYVDVGASTEVRVLFAYGVEK